MKKLLFIPALTFAVCCMMTACIDDNADNPTQEVQINDVSMTTDPTEDQLDVKIQGLTYVFESEYTGEGAALVRRAANRTQNLTDAKIRNIIVPGDKVESLNTEQTTALAALLVRGGSLMLVEPTAEQEIFLIAKIYTAVDNYLNSDEDNPLLDQMDYDNLEWLQNWTREEFKNTLENYDIDAADNSLEIVGWRDWKIYKSFNVHEGESYMKKLSLETSDEALQPSEQSLEYDEQVELSDYQFGLQADEAAAWMNSTGETEETRAQRAEAVRAIALLANEAEQTIDKLATAQEYFLLLGGLVTFKDGNNQINRYHKVLLKRNVWSAYSFEKKRDYYCVSQTVTLCNQDLQCGPADEGSWWNCENWDKWQAFNKANRTWQSFPRPYIYGPYLSEFKLDMYMKDLTPAIEKAAPANSTSGGETESDGVNMQLGANVGYSSSGPSAGVNGSVTWSHSVSRTSPDLQMTASTNSTNGHVGWSYRIAGPDASSTMSLAVKHGAAKDVATKELQLEHAWVWSIESNASTLNIVTDWSMVDEWLSYHDENFLLFAKLKVYEDRLRESFTNDDMKKGAEGQVADKRYSFDRIQRVTCPPRFRQTWSMSIEGDGLTGDQKTKVENYLLDHLTQYYKKSFTLSTYQQGHKKSFNGDKTTMETLDELGREVAKLVQARQTNTNVAQLLKQAGLDAGIPATGSYNIVWRNTDSDIPAGVTCDTETLTVSLK